MTDLEGRCFIRRGNKLIPADFAAEEMLAEIGEGREIMITVRKARNPAHHRWFFAMLRKVVENRDDFGDEEELLDALKLAVGHTELRRKLDGTTYRRPKSINFASMDEFKFARFKARALYVLGQLLGFDPKELMHETDDTQRKHAA